MNKAAPSQESVPIGATHYQPHQKTYYKRVSATEWYLWSCTGKGWIESKGTSDSADWVMLNPIAAPSQEQLAAFFALDDAAHDAGLIGTAPTAVERCDGELDAWNAAPSQEYDINKCPGCGGEADNGHDREVPPSPYYCTKCEAAPSQEPAMTHKIQWESCMTQAEYDALPLGSTIHIHNEGSYVKVGGWGNNHDTLLMHFDSFKLYAPEAVITFKELTHVRR